MSTAVKPKVRRRWLLWAVPAALLAVAAAAFIPVRDVVQDRVDHNDLRARLTRAGFVVDFVRAKDGFGPDVAEAEVHKSEIYHSLFVQRRGYAGVSSTCYTAPESGRPAPKKNEFGGYERGEFASFYRREGKAEREVARWLPPGTSLPAQAEREFNEILVALGR